MTAAQPLAVGTTIFGYCWLARRRQIVTDTTMMIAATKTTDTVMSGCARSPESGVIGFIAVESMTRQTARGTT